MPGCALQSAYDLAHQEDFRKDRREALVLEMCSFVLRIGALRWAAGRASISSSTVMALMLVMLSRMLRHSNMKSRKSPT